MISEHAKAGFEHLFVSALQSRLPRSLDDACEITPVMASTVASASKNTVVVLTIASIRFRLLFILEVAEDERIHSYFAPNSGQSGFKESFFEVANLCCGMMSQGLQPHFPDLGMSTPYILGTGCLAHLESLKPGYLARHAVTINGSVRILATLCVCDHADIDFAPRMTTVDVSAGELELF